MAWAMRSTSTTMVALPRTVIEDADYYAEESGLYSDGSELIMDGVRSMLMDVAAGYTGELDMRLDEYIQVRESDRADRVPIPLTRATENVLERIVSPLGYDVNRFFGMAAMRQIERVVDYIEDVEERLDGPIDPNPA